MKHANLVRALGALAVAFAAQAQAAPFANPLPIQLGGACSFAVLAGGGITNVGQSSITGEVGTYPTPAETGFGTVALSGTNHGGDPVAAAAKADLDTAYGDGMARVSDAVLGTELGGTTVGQGVYNSAAGTFGITGILTLDAQGNGNAVFIFQMASTLITASGSSVKLVNGAQAKNVFWWWEASPPWAAARR